MNSLLVEYLVVAAAILATIMAVAVIAGRIWKRRPPASLRNILDGYRPDGGRRLEALHRRWEWYDVVWPVATGLLWSAAMY